MHYGKREADTQKLVDELCRQARNYHEPKTQINETLPGWIPSVQHPQTACSPVVTPSGTAALKSTIRQQSAPTKPAFSNSSVDTRCPADPPRWGWQVEGLREQQGCRQMV
ncbi:Hypothetical predicted protein [Xyrichtys novacula]|uniref:Uncharacterized protein n=1 Tax=Xyrichtys novacula TaxID=13765 RepID=A0AAV1FEV4_XYRNO|nr:Hypothetical predicted protein [Xyrichtys novacula]